MSVNDLQHLDPQPDEIALHHPKIANAFRQMLFNINHETLMGTPCPPKLSPSKRPLKKPRVRIHDPLLP